jgi:hypothetical protein
MVTKPVANVLNSWKEIAQYLGRGIRTVQRYEREAHLPVRRLGGKTRGAVLALPKDLDNWLKAISLTRISRGEDLRTTEPFPVLDAVRINRLAMCELESNLRLMRQRVEEAQRIRTRRHWFGEDLLQSDVDNSPRNGPRNQGT